MIFWLLKITETSRALVFTFSNDNTAQLSVIIANSDRNRYESLFTERNCYDISIRCNHDASIPFHRMSPPQFLGVVVKRTRNSVHVASGPTLWKFPQSVCHHAFKNGSDVWIRVVQDTHPNASAETFESCALSSS